MNDPRNPVEEIERESANRGKDPGTRKALIILLILWLATFSALLVVSWNAYFKQKDVAQTLAQQIAFACQSGDFGPGISEDNEHAICTNAQKVADDQAPTKSIQGPRGFQGIPGIQGPRGYPGIQGPRGFRGSHGAIGHTGAMGLKGDTGARGAQGDTGLTGPKGDTGDQGPKGDTGDPGPKGDTGETGPSGVVGITTVGCDGPLIRSLSASYDPNTKIVTITCN